MGYRKPPSKKTTSQMFLIATLLILNIATFGLLYFADRAFFSEDETDELEIRYLNTRRGSEHDQRGGQESEDQTETIAREKNKDDTFITKINETLQRGKNIHELGGYEDSNRVALEKRENALVVSKQYHNVNPDEQSVDPGQQLFHKMNELVDSSVIDEIKEGGGRDEPELNSQIQPSQRDGELKPMTQNQEIKKKKKKADYYYNATAREILLRTRRPKPGTSGVGLVTTDGQWGNIDMTNSDERNVGIKILGFTDWKYLHVAKVWYKRLNQLGYTEHFLAAHDE